MASPKVQVEIAANVQKFGAGIGSATKLLTGFLSLGAFAQAARAAIDLGSKINDLSNKAGVSAKWLQEVGYAAQMAGSSMEDVSQAVLDLRRAQVDALKGSKGDVDAFAALGIQVSELRSLQPEQLFDRVADSLEKSGGATKEVAAGLQVLGRGGRQLIGGIVDGFSEARQRAQELGIVLDDETIAAMDDLGDNIDTIKTSITAFTAVILKNMLAWHNWANLAKVVGAVWKMTNPMMLMNAFAQGGPSGVMAFIKSSVKEIDDAIDDYSTSEAENTSDAEGRARKKRDARSRMNAAGLGTITGGSGGGSGSELTVDRIAKIGGYVGGSGFSGASLVRIQSEALNQLRRSSAYLQKISLATRGSDAPSW